MRKYFLKTKSHRDSVLYGSHTHDEATTSGKKEKRESQKGA